MAMSRSESRVARYRGPILSHTDMKVVRLLTRADLLADPHTSGPGSDIAGHQRLSYLGLDSANCRTHLVVVLPGQSSPPHDAPIEHIITLLQGEIRFGVGDDSFTLHPFDQLFIPSDVFYHYTNTGDVPVMFYVVMSPTLGGWPNAEPPDTEVRRDEVAPGDSWYLAPQLTEADTATGRLRRKDEWFAHPWLPAPLGSTWGYQRVLYPGYDAMTCRTAILDLPIGQANPEHAVPVEQIVTALEGTTRVAVGDTTYTLRPLDQIFLPANTRYEFRNVELDTARLLLFVANP